MSGILPRGWTIVPANEVPADWKVVPADQGQTPPEMDPATRAQLEAQEEGARGEGELNPANVKPDISPGATFLEHAGNKAGFGIVPALTGAATALEMKREGDTRPFGDIYRNAVQGTKQDLSRGEMLNPTAATAGKGAGIASTLLLPAGRAAQGLGAAARTAAGVGAIYGGVGGLAGGKGLETLNPGQAALDTAVGAGTGAASGAVLGPVASAVGRGISPVARYIGGKLQSLADSSALKAVGLIGSNVANLRRQNPELPERVASALQSEGIIRPFSKVESNVERLLERQDVANRAVGTTADTVQTALDAKLAEQSARLGSNDPLKVLQAGREGIRANFNTGDLTAGIRNAQGVLEQTPGVAQPALNALGSAAESVGRGGPRELSLREANALKGRLQDQAAAAGAYGSGIQREGPAAIRSVATGAREQMLQTAGQVPGGREAMEGALARATPLNAIADMAQRRADMLSGHSSIGHIGGQVLGGVMGGLVGAGGHGALGPAGLALALGQKGLRQRASSLGAVGGQAGADLANRFASGLENAEAQAGTPVTRYIAGLLSSGRPSATTAVRQLSPSLEGAAGGHVDQALSGGDVRPRAGGNKDPNQP